ncbi:transcription initiation factor TFIID subunit 7-like [Papaver somniferum]|uniref:transcription initiation factor TFIID subunit 7-like n=1 Tax=Papaver somniferum TaxID=3469 RepID=UPI000E6FCF7B|nr:transcription initiation factor TFIID subunit 7-like [Papaver somniferum]XP_026435537.1 transcription initiation factor TFIID subunit 7-like [Papaver somniferum]XP_026435538.1 transcription initiation factor TFIID subunit 7-like [Papaver somniferum]
MEEQFILRVPPSVAEKIELLFNENSASTSEDKASSLDISFLEDGRTGTFAIGDERFPASLLDLPGVVESYKTYDDTNLVKTADIGQIIMVREEGDHSPDGVEYRHGLTPPMRDARRRRFRREPDLNPELVQRVEKDLLNIMAGGTAGNIDVEQEDGGDGNARGADRGKAAAPPPGTTAAAAVKPPEKEEDQKIKENDREPNRSDDSEEDDDDSDDSL